ncbi:hypothetical protein MW887_008132 [Aspergillus wentii]|nr:hypothetical protein MW887_008132 [Aspergillus wentii]
MPPNTRNDFEIAIICALPHEADAVEALFDETYATFNRIYGKQDGDLNIYSNGKLGQHDVVLCLLPEMGKGNAATVSSSLRISYPRVQLGLLVGICGAVPFPRPDGDTEIIMGDVIISDSVIEYDFGSQYPDGFRRKTDVKSTLGRPTREIRNLLASLKTRSGRNELQRQTLQHLITLQSLPENEWEYPGAAQDVLFEASYRHKHYQRDRDTCICLNCNASSDPVCEEALKKDCAILNCSGKPVYRSRHGIQACSPQIIIGTVASADTVMKSGEHRDKLAWTEAVIGFEMEGAGVWDNLPCVIVKGACDYADSHKNNRWQSYAAATGASGAKAFLGFWRPSTVRQNITDADKRCLADLLLTDPRDDKLRIEKTKGDLLRESFCWIIDDISFQEWYCNEQSQLLWIRGDAGKGKTMLMIGIINELTQRISKSSERENLPILAYFLCQATDTRLNNALSVLRGLIFLLTIQRPSLLRHARHKYDYAGHRLFNEPYSLYSLVGIFTSIIGDSDLPEVFLAIDAVDECEAELPQLLDLIAHTTSMKPKIKWIVSSRNRDDIERHMRGSCSQRILRLELNADKITGAIDKFIDVRVSQLSSLESHASIQNQIRSQMRQKSNGTFLWASLVFDELRKASFAADTLEILEETPTGLVPLFSRMMKKLLGLPTINLQRSIKILSVVLLSCRPLHLLEMRVVAGLPVEINHLEELDRLVTKDYLDTEQSTIIYAAGRAKIHREIYCHSLSAMSVTLRRDICDLKDPGPVTDNSEPNWAALLPIQTLADNVELSDNEALFAFFATHLLHWFESLGLMRQMSVGIKIIERLLQTVQADSFPEFTKLLYDSMRLALAYTPIIETAPLQVYSGALIFSPQTSETRRRFWESRLPFVKSITGVQKNWNTCLQTIEDHGKSRINDICFSPDDQTVATASSDSTIKLWDTVTGLMKQSLVGHKERVNSICFLQDAHHLASGSDDGRVILWDAVTGASECIMQSEEGMVSAIAFSPGVGTLAAGISSGTVMLWDFDTKIWRHILEGDMNLFPTIRNKAESEIRRVAASNNARDRFIAGQINTVERDCIVVDLGGDNPRAFLEAVIDSVARGARNRVVDLHYSSDGRILACAWSSGHVSLWFAQKNEWKGLGALGISAALNESLLELDESLLKTYVIFTSSFFGWYWIIITLLESPDSDKSLLRHRPAILMYLASTIGYLMIYCKKIIDMSPSRLSYSDAVFIIWKLGPAAGRAFILKPKSLMPRPDGSEVPLGRNASTGKWEWRGHLAMVSTMALSPDQTILATGSGDQNIILWDTGKKTLKGHMGEIDSVHFTADSEMLASLSREDSTVRLWDASSGACRYVIKYRSSRAAWSPDGLTLALAPYQGQRTVNTSILIGAEYLSALDLSSDQCPETDSDTPLKFVTVG